MVEVQAQILEAAQLEELAVAALVNRALTQELPELIIPVGVAAVEAPLRSAHLRAQQVETADQVLSFFATPTFTPSQSEQASQEQKAPRPADSNEQRSQLAPGM